MFICQYCGSNRKSLKSLTAHEATCPDNPIGYRNVPWNKGKTKENTPQLLELSNSMLGRKRPEISGIKNPNFGKPIGCALTGGHTLETKMKLSKIAKLRGIGGYIRGSGRGKKGWYKGFFCDSSWELAYVIYCLDHHIDIKRNVEKRYYSWNGKTKVYIPDFVVDGTVVEIKGFKTEQWLAKLEANCDIKVLYKEELKPVFAYVRSKYGKDFTSLYEQGGATVLASGTVLKTV